jgi:phage pi2 protein 07
MLAGLYVGYPESKFWWAIEKKKQQEFISKPFILPFDVHTIHYFST